MSRQRWPRIERYGRNLNEPTECDACDKPAIGWVDIRFGPMRGSDIDRVFVCERHYKMGAKEFKASQLAAHCRTKGKHLAKKARAS